MWGTRGAYTDLPVTVPCGRCMGCRLEHARQWAMRCMLEASMHEFNCFITLTYNDKNLPVDGSVSKREMQLFLKQIRNNYGSGIKFYGCGEYGKKLSRPHYHICLFNFDFKDKYVHKSAAVRGFRDDKFRDMFTLYRSPQLEKIWDKGYSTIGTVNFHSAGYVARYCTKKIYGEIAEEHYGGRQPEFALMSRGNAKTRSNGIGRDWLLKFKNDLYPKDFLMLNGRHLKPPKYFDRVIEQDDPKLYQKIKSRRINQAIENNEGLTRLFGKEKAMTYKLQKLERIVENG